MENTIGTIIQKVLKSEFTQASLQKAYSIYHNQQIKFEGFNLKTGKYNFTIPKDYLDDYELSISFTEKTPSAEFSCSCPYYGLGLCKHIGAGLVFINNHMVNKEATQQALFQETEIKPVVKPFVKPVVEMLNRNKISKAMEVPLSEKGFTVERFKNVFNKRFNHDYLKSIKLEGFSLEFHFSARLNYGNQIIAKVSNKNNILSISCNCNDRAKGLCCHETEAIQYLLNKNPEIVHSLEEGNLQTLKARLLEKNGVNVPESEVDDYIKLSYDGKEFIGIAHKKAEGMYFTGQGQNALLTAIQRGEEQFKFALLKSETKNTELKPAIAIELSTLNDFSLEFVPIKGKPTAAGDKLVSNLSLVEDDEIFSVFPEERHELANQVLNFKKFILKAGYNLQEDLATQARLFQYSSGIFKMLPGEITYYTYKSLSFDVRKSSIISVGLIESPTIEFTFKEEAVFYCLQLNFNFDGNLVPYNPFDKKVLLMLHPFIGKYGSSLFHLNSINDFLLLQKAGETFMWRCVKSNLAGFCAEIVEPLSKKFKIHFDKGLILKQAETFYPDKKRIYISEFENSVIFSPAIVYENGIEKNIFHRNEDYQFANSKVEAVDYNYDAAENFEDFMRNLHPSFTYQLGNDFFHLGFEEMMKDFWFYEAFEKLKKYDVEVLGLNDLKKFRHSVYKPKVDVSVKSGINWFETDVEVAFGDERVSVDDLEKAIESKSRYIQLKDNKVGMLPEEWLEKFARIFRNSKKEKGSLKISKLNFNIIDEFINPLQNPEITEEIAQKKERIKHFNGIENVELPKQIKATLRNYQKEGLNWLNFLHEFGWGGILADDMGLGKTLQVITFLQMLLNKNEQGPHLIVAPTSLLFNWQDELKKFAPKLKYHLHYGLDRLKDGNELAKNYIIITSYGTLMNDIDFIEDIQFNYAILDESQAVKNIFSQRYKAVCMIKSKNRLALTGTPVENNTTELFAQMNFVNPGFLFSLNNFKKNYSNPIDNNHDEDRSRELKTKLAPFILRRVKKAVLTELPEKEEEVLYCIMDDAQRKVYDAYRNKYRQHLMGLIEKDGLNKSVIHVLEGLTKLRQICNAPLMVDEAASSIKLKELMRYLVEKTGDEKVLVFSQFVKMLQLIEEELKKKNITYQYLDGSTTQKQREKNVKEFQTDESSRVFLISLKAGGVGLNLTEAQTVFIVDPWWNPAVENQAIDRCYRIGQKKNVIAYRMICKDTIEEKIITLQQKKKNLAENLLGTPEKSIAKLTKEDIEELFS